MSGEYDVSESILNIHACSIAVVGTPATIAVLGSSSGRPMAPKPVNLYSGSMSTSKKMVLITLIIGLT